jgi:unsaturated chondroitin disaccharide hydrolase
MKLLMNIEVNFADWSKDTDFVIGKSSGWYWKEQNTNIIYADYYFAEAIYKLKGFKPLFW